MTVWPGQLKFTASTAPAVWETVSHTATISSGERPMTAAMPPRPSGTASCINFPRRCTVCTASEKSIAHAATSAVYSPRLCPAATSGKISFSASTRAAATPAVSTAGCVNSVFTSSVSGPSNMRRDKENPSVSSASFKSDFTTSYLSYKSRVMPTFCDPCPGKIIACFTRFLLPRNRIFYRFNTNEARPSPR